LVDALGWMVLQASQHISKPGKRIDVIELGGLCRAPNYAVWASFSPGLAMIGM